MYPSESFRSSSPSLGLVWVGLCGTMESGTRGGLLTTDRLIWVTCVWNHG